MVPKPPARRVAYSSGRLVTKPLRLLYVGPFNSPHVEDLALAMHARGHQVRVAGEVWGGLPPSSLDDRGVPATVLGFPSVLALRRVLRAFRPDVVHSHWMPFAMLAAAAGARPLVAQAWDRTSMRPVGATGSSYGSRCG